MAAKAALVTYGQIAASKAQRANSAHPSVTSIPAPVGGWNTRDALANMDPLDAVTMDDWWPTASYLEIRSGCTDHVTQLPAVSNSLMVYTSGTTSKMFSACTDGKFYDATTAGVAGAAVVTGLNADAFWNHVNVTTAGGSYMYVVDRTGTDAPRLYDGAAWTTITGASVPAITGVTTTTLFNVNLFKNRLWFIQKQTLKAWYLPTSAISGLAVSFDFSAIARKGGYLVEMGTWTVDAGYGIDDLAVFVTSQGEIIVYKGTDPASSATWGLVGVWQVGIPIPAGSAAGGKCLEKYGGDMLYLSVEGVSALSTLLQSTRIDMSQALTDKIRPSFVTSAQAAQFSTTALNWQMLLAPQINMLLVNVMAGAGPTLQQYAMNTITKAWTRFKFKIRSMALFNNNIYFGNDGFAVMKAWNGYVDNTGLGGTAANVAPFCIQAYNYFGSPGVNKRFTLVRPNMSLTGTTTLAKVNVSVDMDTSTGGSSLSADGMKPLAWLGATTIGKSGSIRFGASASEGPQRWMSTDIVYEKGGVL